MSRTTRFELVLGIAAFAVIVGAFAIWWPAGMGLALLLGVIAVLVLHNRVDTAARFELERARLTGPDWFEELDRRVG